MNFSSINGITAAGGMQGTTTNRAAGTGLVGDTQDYGASALPWQPLAMSQTAYGMLGSTPGTAGGSQLQNTNQVQRAQGETVVAPWTPPNPGSRFDLGAQHGALQNSSQLQNNQARMQWTAATDGSGVAPGVQGPNLPPPPQGAPFDANDPNNAALAGYMAR